jgi:uncharacterized protein YdhG (YjbR/CyaY superfamily)
MPNFEPRNFEEYRVNFPPPVQAKLEEMRAAVRSAAPTSLETISYKMPAFTLGGKTLVHFAAFKAHLGFYPGVASIANFSAALSDYKTAKGSVQFPYSSALPTKLIERIVRFKAGELRRSSG